MKLWKWYKCLHGDAYEASSNLDIQDRYPLYAFTNNKKYRNGFRSMRKPENFIEIQSEVTKEEYVNFCNSRNKQMLNMYSYTHFPKGKIYGKEKEVKILSTGDEYDTTAACLEDVFNTDSMQGLMKYDFNPFILKDKYINLLHKMQYIDLWKMYTHEKINHKILEELGYDSDYSYPDLRYNEFMGFIGLYGDTFIGGTRGDIEE